MKVIRFFIWEVRYQENVSEIFGGKVRRGMKKPGPVLMMYLVIASVRCLHCKNGKMLFI